MKDGALGPDPIDDPLDDRVRRIGAVLRGGRRGRGTIVIDDEENIWQAARSGVEITRVYRTVSQPAPHDLLRLLPDNVPVDVLTDEVARAVFGGERRARLFALARRPRPARLVDVLSRPGDVVVLDGVRLTGNIGAVIRSACAFGAAGVVLLDSGLSCVSDRRLIRASRGHVFTIPVVITGPGEVINRLGSSGTPLLALNPRAKTPLHEIARTEQRIAILLGGERTGSSPLLTAHADGQVGVRTCAVVESLNVSVTAGLALYLRQHQNMHRG